MKVLCFGSLNIDYTYKLPHFVRPGETISAEALQVFPGGKGLNQSLALAKAGAEVCHAGAVGEDGRFLLDLLRVNGVNTDFTEIRTDVRTGNAIIQNDAAGDNCIILYGGANRAVTRQQVDKTLAAFGPGDWLLLQNEISETAYIMERAAALGMKVVLNPSPMNERIFALPLDRVGMLLLNEVEGSQLTGLPADGHRDILETLRRSFPKTAIVLTLGAQGAWYAEGDRALWQKAYPVQAVDTTAAGDTFTGYFLASILEGKDPADALRRAARAAAIAVTRPGAATSIPTPEEVDTRDL